MAIIEQATIEVNADTSDVKEKLTEMESLGKKFGTALSGALQGAITGGKSLTDVLRGIGLQFANLTLKSALNPIENMLSKGFGDLFKSVLPFAAGGVVGTESVAPFAAGGVVTEPSFFRMPGGRLGLMGEAGAEAILPLSRGPDGRLGVRAEGGGAPTHVTVNIQTQDLKSFRRSEAQVSAALARAVGRGRRGL